MGSKNAANNRPSWWARTRIEENSRFGYPAGKNEALYASHSQLVMDAFNICTGIAGVIVAVMLHGIWRLWRGMRQDSFDRGLRRRRQDPLSAMTFPSQCSLATTKGLLPFSLLPMMLASCGIAMLLAQAPDLIRHAAIRT